MLYLSSPWRSSDSAGDRSRVVDVRSGLLATEPSSLRCRSMSALHPEATKILQRRDWSLSADCVAKVFLHFRSHFFRAVDATFGYKREGTSSLGDKFTGDFGNEPGAISISDLDLLRFLAGKLSPVNFGLLQQYWHLATNPAAPEFVL